MIQKHLIYTFLCLSLINCSDAIALEQPLSQSAVDPRIESIEKTLAVLQKYVYNLGAISLSHSNNNQSPAEKVNVEGIGDQFKAMRSDIDGMNKEIGELNDKLSKLALDLEQKLADLEVPVKDSLSDSSTTNISDSSADEDKTRSMTKDDAVPDEFRKAYALVKDKKYDEARQTFEKFIRHNPNHSLIGSAYYWLGEIYMQTEHYDKAVAEYLKGYQSSGTGGRAPDNLLKLSEALLKLGKREQCCFTLKKLEVEFPNMPISIRKKSQALFNDAICQ